MKFISLFTGIGGIDLGLEQAGMTCVAQVENDPYCNQILQQHWPNTPRFGDIHDIQQGDLPNADLIAGGFPCQPVSYAGKRKGQNDERWLWPQFHRIIRMVRPEYVLVENVPGLLTAGFGEVAGDLAASGYDFEWTRLSAATVGAPHLRNRIFIVAYVPESDSERGGWLGRVDGNTGGQGWEPAGSESAGVRSSAGGSQDGDVGPLRQIVADPDNWTVEPDVGRVANGIPNRVDRLKALGNAVVPQVAQHIGTLIMNHHHDQ